MSSMDVRGSLPEILDNEDQLYFGDLVHYFQVIFNNAKNLGNPYHNFRHLFHTLYLAYEACVYYGDVLDKRTMRNLLIAAMFHDFDHPGRTGNDDLNIEIALRGLAKHILPEDGPYFNDIADIIRPTEFPHKISSDTLPLPAQILRDCDASQALSVAWIQQVVIGLSAEMGIPTRDLLAMQEPFLSRLTFSTTWAKEKFNHGIIDAKVEESRQLLALLDRR
jgi:hypothetical protein